MKYVWQNEAWPCFQFDLSITADLETKFLKSAFFMKGQNSVLNEDAQYEAYIELLMSEAISTSSIEGEVLDRESVRSSLKNFLGLNSQHQTVNDPRAEGIAALMVDVRKQHNKELSNALLFNWQSMVVQPSLYKKPLIIGAYRQASDPMVIASGPIGYEKIHYEAPPALAVANEMQTFLTWYNKTSRQQKPALPPICRSAIAHLWFECIHPFDDGNGRIGRAIAEHALGQGADHSVILSLSSAIERNKNSYYEHLQRASCGELNINEWLLFFANTVIEAQETAAAKVAFVIAKSKFWDTHKNVDINARQVKLIKKMFDEGPEGFLSGVNARKYQSLSSCSKATATRDLSDLLNKNILQKLPGSGRNTRYSLRLS